MWKDFKAFIFKGNVIDLAVAVIIGGAFGKIVTSLVGDIITPLIGLITGGKNFESMFVLLKRAPAGTVVKTLEEAKTLELPTLNYGAFISNIIDFLIIALVIFLTIRMMTKLTTAAAKRFKKNGTVPPPTTKECEYCMSTINIKAKRCPNCTSQLE
ncbi:MAG: large conductance mechanosensitive channel protein MscL [Saccharofermentanales bacterium]